jgi:hypothetical protein
MTRITEVQYLELANVILVSCLLLTVIAGIILLLLSNMSFELRAGRKQAQSEPDKNPSPPEVDIQCGASTLIKGGDLKGALDLMNARFNDEYHKIIFSRKEPGIIREAGRFDENSTIFWITHMDEGDMRLKVNDVSKLFWNIKQIVINFRKAVIFIDCLEYLIFINNFSPVTKMINEVIDLISGSEVALVLWVDPRIFEEKELLLLEKCIDVIVER